MDSKNHQPPEEGPSLTSVLSASFHSRSPIAEEVIAQDVAACSGDDVSETSDAPEPTLYRRLSGVAYGTARPTVNDLSEDAGVLITGERVQSRDAERALLRDNHILPSESGQRRGESIFSEWYRSVRGRSVESRQAKPDVAAEQPRETSPLLPGAAGHRDEELNQQWNEAVAAGRLRTSFGREAKTIGSYAAPLLLASLLQYSVNVVCIFAVGKIGKMELGAVSRRFQRLIIPYFCFFY